MTRPVLHLAPARPGHGRVLQEPHHTLCGLLTTNTRYWASPELEREPTFLPNVPRCKRCLRSAA